MLSSAPRSAQPSGVSAPGGCPSPRPCWDLHCHYPSLQPQIPSSEFNLLLVARPVLVSCTPAPWHAPHATQFQQHCTSQRFEPRRHAQPGRTIALCRYCHSCYLLFGGRNNPHKTSLSAAKPALLTFSLMCQDGTMMHKAPHVKSELVIRMDAAIVMTSFQTSSTIQSKVSA